MISTNSITQTFSRRVIARHLEAKKPVSLVFAIPDHPWLKAPDRAAVRIAMTVGEAGQKPGHLHRVVEESGLDSDTPRVVLDDTVGVIGSDLTIGPNVSRASPLTANDRLCYRGYQLIGAGFIVTPGQAAALGLGRVAGVEKIIKPYRNGKDLTARPRGVMVIDLFGMNDAEARDRYPAVYQRVIEHVKPERDLNNRAAYRKNWWIFGEPRTELRGALKGLTRYIATVETEKHRMFEFLPAETAPDNKLVVISSDDAYVIGVLSSRIHVTWAVAAGGWLGVGNDPVYVKSACFDAFPFPDTSEGYKEKIRAFGLKLDAFRKERLAQHKPLTMTKLYNVLEKIRAGGTLNETDVAINEMGLVSTLKQIHDELDQAVADAYGWRADLTDERILENLVALNRQRAVEEREGLVRWLRPEFQAPAEGPRKARQIEAEFGDVEEVFGKPDFPRAPGEQVSAVRLMLAAEGKPIRAGDLARRFRQGGRIERRVGDLLQIMAAIGQAQTENGSRYFAAR